MSAKVIRLPKLHQVEPIVDGNIVQYLEEALAEAKRGEVQQVVIVKISGAGNYSASMIGTKLTLAGALERAKMGVFDG